ncbi:MAG: methionyl-tRNA formyltransferase [Hyphomicrobiales bacterium]|nr:methionyl-tRNA formyltransferase [Hyphomicrobiales bacterium]
MNIIFMGTPDIAVNTLGELIAQGHDIVAVYCQPPRPAGRGKTVRKTAVHDFADDMGLNVYTPLNFKNPADIEVFANHNADIAVVVAYGLLLPKPVLDAPKHGCLNLHASLLPRWRGAAPIQRAIMAGDAQTGVMVMQMDEGLDTGDICLIETIQIQPNMTAGELHDEMAPIGANLMARAISAIEWGGNTATPQAQDGACYAKKIDKAEAKINWQLPAAKLHDHIRGLSPFPGAWCEFVKDGKPVRIKILQTQLLDANGNAGEVLDDELSVACGIGGLKITRLQRAGKGVSGMADFQRGFFIGKGQTFS